MTISNKQRKPIRKAAKPDMKGYAWHAIPVGQVLQLWETSDKGLASWQVEKRREIFGENRLPEPKSIGPVMRFMLQFHNVLIYVLISAGVVTALLGHWIDASVIFGVVVLNAIIGFVQEGTPKRGIEQRLLFGRKKRTDWADSYAVNLSVSEEEECKRRLGPLF